MVSAGLCGGQSHGLLAGRRDDRFARLAARSTQPNGNPSYRLRPARDGSILIGVGLVLMGLLAAHVSVGGQASTWLQAKVGEQQGALPDYLLGVALSFTFCPTLFWLFFGLTLQLAIASPGGLLLPGVFAVGTALPVLGLAGLLASGAVNVGQYVKRFKAADVWLRRAVGLVFVLVGINEILLYWFI